MNDGNNNRWENFFHGIVTLEVAEERLRAVNINGGYLARKSPLNLNELIITYLHGGKVRNFILPKRESSNIIQGFHSSSCDDIILYITESMPALTVPILRNNDHENSQTRPREKNQCYVCEHSFANISNHIKKYRIYKCNTCEAVLSKDCYSSHIQRCSGEAPLLRCNYCDYETVTLSNLYKHKRNIHSKFCTICDSEFDCLKALIQHKESEHQRIHSCQDCDKSFSTKDTLRVHSRRSVCKKVFHCPKCDFTSKTKSEIELHKRLSHRSMKKSFKKRKVLTCTYCTKDFGREYSNFYRHLHCCKKRPRALEELTVEQWEKLISFNDEINVTQKARIAALTVVKSIFGKTALPGNIRKRVEDLKVLNVRFAAKMFCFVFSSKVNFKG